jgi:Tfp pilus assembly protein PilN
MSTAVATKTKKEKPGLKLSLSRGSSAPSKKTDVLSVGGTPRVSLLPPEVHARKGARRLRRRLGLVLVASVVIVAGAMALATVSLLASQAALVKAQSDSAALTAQQAKYGAVTKLQLDATGIKAGQITATTTEIDWQKYIASVGKTLRPGMSIDTIGANIDNAAAVATDGPLQGAHVATLKLTVTSPQASISDWLISLQTLPGFVDGTPGSVTLVDGAYKIDVVIHINKAALETRFAAEK